MMFAIKYGTKYLHDFKLPNKTKYTSLSAMKTDVEWVPILSSEFKGFPSNNIKDKVEMLVEYMRWSKKYKHKKITIIPIN